MTKLLILSDSHRNVTAMTHACRLEKPDRIIHLGDHFKDAMELQRQFPDIPLDAVPGNCDLEREPEEKLILIDGKKIFLCHGHQYHVKDNYLSLEYAAREKEADIVLFGHTHRVFAEQQDHLFMLNPGSIGAPLYPGKYSYGLVLIDQGQIFLQTHILKTDFRR